MKMKSKEVNTGRWRLAGSQMTCDYVVRRSATRFELMFIHSGVSCKPPDVHLVSPTATYCLLDHDEEISK